MTRPRRPAGWALASNEATTRLVREIAHACAPRRVALIAWDEETANVRIVGEIEPDTLAEIVAAVAVEGSEIEDLGEIGGLH